MLSVTRETVLGFAEDVYVIGGMLFEAKLSKVKFQSPLTGGCYRMAFHTHDNAFTTVFSERELTFTFSICYRPSVCLSSVCNACAPHSGGSNFQQYFYGIRYLGELPPKILRRSSQGNSYVGGAKHKRGSQV